MAQENDAATGNDALENPSEFADDAADNTVDKANDSEKASGVDTDADDKDDLDKISDNNFVDSGEDDTDSDNGAGNNY